MLYIYLRNGLSVMYDCEELHALQAFLEEPKPHYSRPSSLCKCGRDWNSIKPVPYVVGTTALKKLENVGFHSRVYQFGKCVLYLPREQWANTQELINVNRSQLLKGSQRLGRYVLLSLRRETEGFRIK